MSARLGPGIPGLQLGFGFGAGCGVGLGFGYGVGRGIAQDDKRRYSNVGDLLHGHQSIFPQRFQESTFTWRGSFSVELLKKLKAHFWPTGTVNFMLMLKMVKATLFDKFLV